MADPSNIYAIDELKFLTGYNIEPVVASRERASRRRSSRYYDKGPDLRRDDRRASTSTTSSSRGRRRGRQRRRAREQAGEAPVVKLVQRDPAQRRSRRGASRHPHRAVREELPRPLPHRRRAPRGDAAAAQAAATRSRRRLKIMASLDIAERRLPQDGRIKLKLGKGKRDGLPRLACCRRCAARRSSCASSTSRTCSST